jgi:hypothetical protein
MTRPLKRPMRVALADAQQGLNPYASQPSRVQLAASKPAHSPLSRAAAHSCSDLCRPSRAPHNPDPSTPRRPKPVTPQMRLQYSVEAQRLLPYCAKNGRKPFDQIQRAYSLTLAMGLTTILTRHISVRPPKWPKCRVLIFKENWTSGDVHVHAADVWGSRAMSVLSDPAATGMIFPLTDDLVQRQGEQGF